MDAAPYSTTRMAAANGMLAPMTEPNTATPSADPDWRAVRPPWIQLPQGAQSKLLGALEKAGMRVGPSRAV